MSNQSDSPRALEDRIWLSMLSAAFFSPQSAIIIALSIIFFVFGLSPFGWWQPAFWLIFGAISLLLYIGVTVTDKNAQQRVIQMLLTDRYDPSEIKNQAARKNLEKALEYFSAIQGLTSTRSGAGRMEFQNVVDELDRLIQAAYELGKRIDDFESDTIINRDRMQARRELDDLNRRIAAEPDASVKEEIRRSIQFKELQLENIKSLETNIKRADIQMDNVLTQLGVIYAQMRNIGTKDLDSSRTKRLQGEVHDMVMGLQDTISAMEEIQSQRAS